MSVILRGTPESFHAPPINTTAYINGRKAYYTANMENVDGVLGVDNGGTGNSTFKDNEVVIYSKGKFVSAGITSKELAMLSGLAPSTEDGSDENPATIVELLNAKISTISTSSGVTLDMDEETRDVKLPDYLLRSGGTVDGDLQVNGDFAVGNMTFSYDENTGCIVFKVVE